MSKNTSISLSPHFQDFIDSQVKAGHYASASEVMRAALRMFEERTTKLDHLRAELAKGEVGEGISIDSHKAKLSKMRAKFIAEQGITK